MELEKLMESFESGGGNSWEPKGTAEEMVAELEAAIEASSKPCPFKVGDLVTPKKNSNKKGRGKPYKVMEVLPEPALVFEPKKGDPLSMYDMVVGIALYDGINLYRENSRNYEPWKAAKVQKKKSA